MPEERSALIVGNLVDPHASVVAERLKALGVLALLIDAATVPTHRWRWNEGNFEFLVADEWRRPRTAWLRRLAPPGAHTGISLGSRAGAEASARLSLLAALSDAPIEWLTDFWSLTRAENKLVQYRHAAASGINVPPAVVVSDVQDVPPGLDDRFVVKPLGVGDFVVDGVAHAVHTRLVSRADPALSGLGQAPFLLQRFIEASAHLRIVTVARHTWCARLDANGLPVDWRQHENAHYGWQPDQQPAVESQARTLAQALGLGYSSQDWIIDRSGTAWFVDGNPAGQWLFLPEPTASEITEHLCIWLAGRRVGDAM